MICPSTNCPTPSQKPKTLVLKLRLEVDVAPIRLLRRRVIRKDALKFWRKLRNVRRDVVTKKPVDVRMLVVLDVAPRLVRMYSRTYRRSRPVGAALLITPSQSKDRVVATRRRNPR